MGSISKIISTAMENLVISTIEKKLGFRLETTHVSQSGDDSPPLPEDKNFIVPSDEAGRYITLGNLMISQGAEPGEKILYARDEDGNLVNSIYLQKDGTMSFTNENGSFEIDPDGNHTFNNGTDNAVRYSKLQIAFDTLKTDFNNLVTAYTAHVHNSPETGAPTGPPLAPGTPTTADITGAKIEEVKVP